MLGSGLFLGGAAMSLVAQCPVGMPWRAVALIACATLVSAELHALAGAYRGVAEYRIAPDGSVTARHCDGRQSTGQLLPGSVLLERCAWLRLSTVSGPRYGELVAKQSQSAQDWRRLRVICRHLSAC